MKKELRPVYICEHCKKKMLGASAMSVHEIWCHKNPDNYRVCSDCLHLKEAKIIYWTDWGGEGDCKERTCNGFHCDEINKDLYPVKAEKKKLPQRFPETFENQEPFRRSCDKFKWIYTNLFE